MSDERFPYIPDGFFDNAENTAAYMASIKQFGQQNHWCEAGFFAVPLHRDAFAAATKWATTDEDGYQRAFSRAWSRYSGTIYQPSQDLLSAMDEIVDERYDIDGTDYSDLNPFDPTGFPTLFPLAVNALRHLLGIALGTSVN